MWHNRINILICGLCCKTQLITDKPHLNKPVTILIVYTYFQHPTNYEFRLAVYYRIAPQAISDFNYMKIFQRPRAN